MVYCQQINPVKSKAVKCLQEIPCKKKKVIVFQILRDGILVYVYFFIYYFIKQYNGSILILNTKISLIANVLMTIIID